MSWRATSLWLHWNRRRPTHVEGHLHAGKDTFTRGGAPQPVDPEIARLDRTVTPHDMARCLADLHRKQLLPAEGPRPSSRRWDARWASASRSPFRPVPACATRPGHCLAVRECRSTMSAMSRTGWSRRRDGGINQGQPDLGRTCDARQGDRPCRPCNLRRRPAPRAVSWLRTIAGSRNHIAEQRYIKARSESGGYVRGQ